MQLSNIGNIKEILTRHGFTFSKALGQNFLINPSVCPRMADYSIPDKDTCVIEVGPGIGVLTCELAKRAERVVAVELDKRLVKLDQELLELDKKVPDVNHSVSYGYAFRDETEDGDTHSVFMLADQRMYDYKRAHYANMMKR